MSYLSLTHGKVIDTNKVCQDLYEAALAIGLDKLLRNTLLKPEFKAELEAALVPKKSVSFKQPVRSIYAND